MKVLKWTDYPLISGEEQQARWNKVGSAIQYRKAERKWRSYQAGLMKGKKLVFDKNSFETLSTWAMEKYASLNKEDSLKFQISEVPSIRPGINFSAPFFTIDNKTWTIGDFKNELMSHPLVFRTMNLDSVNFKEQFKLAVVDMVRDHYLTRAAYKNKLDGDKQIKKSIEMWRDSFLAADQAKNVMDDALVKGEVRQDDNNGKLKYWESYINNLQKKYSKSIRVDYNKFNKIKLTATDMVAWQTGVPYPIVSPGFPILISSENLDYAKNGK
jgi:hypothetical protein